MRVILLIVAVIAVVIAAGVVLSELGQRRPSAASERLKDRVYEVPGVLEVTYSGRMAQVVCDFDAMTRSDRQQMAERAYRWGAAIDPRNLSGVYVTNRRGWLVATWHPGAGWTIHPPHREPATQRPSRADG